MVLLNGNQVRFTTDGGDTFTASVGSNAYPNNCSLPFDGAPIKPSVVSGIPKFVGALQDIASIDLVIETVESKRGFVPGF